MRQTICELRVAVFAVCYRQHILQLTREHTRVCLCALYSIRYTYNYTCTCTYTEYIYLYLYQYLYLDLCILCLARPGNIQNVYVALHRTSIPSLLQHRKPKRGVLRKPSRDRVSDNGNRKETVDGNHIETVSSGNGTHKETVDGNHVETVSSENGTRKETCDSHEEAFPPRTKPMRHVWWYP